MTVGDARVLVAVASRHGSTQEIAKALASRLSDSPAGRTAGMTAFAASVDHHPDPAQYSAVVLGSAVYAGRWLEPARTYAATYGAALRGRPVWLFSSGPIGEPPFPPDEPHDAAPLLQLTGARGHRVFPGRLAKARLSFGERPWSRPCGHRSVISATGRPSTPGPMRSRAH